MVQDIRAQEGIACSTRVSSRNSDYVCIQVITGLSGEFQSTNGMKKGLRTANHVVVLWLDYFKEWSSTNFNTQDLIMI